jgi:flagellar motor switch protein FliM
MSKMSAEKLSKKKIQQLLASAASEPCEDATQNGAEEYNWHQPHCFTRSQINKLDDFTRTIAKGITRKFASLCHGDFSVTIASTGQHFASELVEEALESKKDDYYLAFGRDQSHICGFVNIPIKTAFIWATQLLGDTASEEVSRTDLSQLEESLLSDIASAIVIAVSESHAEHDFQPVKTIVKGKIPLELQATEEFYRITFEVKRSGANGTEAHILIPCRELESIAGKAEQAIKVSAEDVSKAVLERLNQMSVSVAARLASVSVSFEEVMNLEPGDILIIDKKIDEPIELLVEGRPLFYGRPAKSADKYAIMITEAGQKIRREKNM